jgi:hypothetical protein
LPKLRGTEAEIQSRLRELTQEFRQLRKELSDTTQKRVSGKGLRGKSADRLGSGPDAKGKPR